MNSPFSFFFSFVILSSLLLSVLSIPHERLKRGGYGRPSGGYGRPSYGNGGNYGPQGPGGFDDSFNNGGNFNQFPNNNGNFNNGGNFNGGNNSPFPNGFPVGAPGFNSGSDPSFG